MRPSLRTPAVDCHPRAGFSRLELVALILIIAFFVALLLPAIDVGGREASRRNQCMNNLKQLALAALNHESAKKFLPSGGWGHNWVGDSDQGFGKNQPGGWAYSTMFFMYESSDLQPPTGMSPEEQRAWNARMIGAGPDGSDNQRAVQPVFYCPSRRPAALYPFPAAIANPGAGGTNYGPTYPPYTVAKGDYAANGGTMGLSGRFNQGNGPNDIQAGELADSIAATAASLPEPDATWYLVPYGPPAEGKQAEHISPPPADASFTGVVWYRSQVTLRMITDGMSKAYLFGEKYMDQYTYTMGYDGNGDEENLYVGMDDDNIRLGASAGTHTPVDAPRSLSQQEAASVNVYGPFRYPPRQDAAVWPGRDGLGKRPKGVPVDKFNALGFGGPHAGAVNMAFCDGSVHAVSYDIDPRVHAMLCDRQDGEEVHGKKFLVQ